MLNGVQDDDALIEVQVRHNGALKWKSLATSPHITVELKAIGQNL